MKVYLLYEKDVDYIQELKRGELTEEALAPGGETCSVFVTLLDAQKEAFERAEEQMAENWRDRYDPADCPIGADEEEAMDAWVENQPPVVLEWTEVDQGVPTDSLGGRGCRTRCWQCEAEEVCWVYYVREEELRGFTREHAAEWLLDDTLPG